MTSKGTNLTNEIRAALSAPPAEDAPACRCGEYRQALERIKAMGDAGYVPGSLHNALAIARQMGDIADKALASTTAGAPLLAEVWELRRQNKAMRNCGNCKHEKYNSFMSFCGVSKKADCWDNDYRNWQYRGEGDGR